MNNDTVYRHSDILQRLYAEIATAFDKVGGITPALSELHETAHWRYCKTQNKNDVGKIGYRCTFSFSGLKPIVKIVVHSFKHGGETATFNSSVYPFDAAFSNQVKPVKRLIPRQQFEKSEAKELQVKKEKYLTYLKQWQASSSVVDNHAYVIRKNILYTSPLRLVGQRAGFVLQSIDNKICGLQFIDVFGQKRVYGEKKGAFAVLGKLEPAEILYLCEGYATGNAIYHLASRKNSYAIIVGIDAANMVVVAKLLKQKYPLKKLIVCADNDAKTQAKGKGNPGLIQGFEAAIQNYAEIKIPISDYGSDWCDWWQHKPVDAQTAFQQKNPIRLQDYALSQLQQFKINEQGLVFKKALFRTFKILANQYLLKFDEDTLLSLVFDAAKHTGISFQALRDIWVRVKKRRFGMALRTKTFSMQSQDNMTVIECASILEMTQQINKLKTKHPRAIFATNAPMGTGKTQTLMQPEFLAAEQQMLLPLIITPMRSLTQGVAERFNAFHYQNDLNSIHDKENLPASLAITINSIINPSYQHCFDYCRALFIDEYTQVLRAITLGTVDNHLRQATENKLASLIQQAYYVYIADADLNQIALDHIQAMVNFDTPIFVFTLKIDKDKINKTETNKAKTDKITQACATQNLDRCRGTHVITPTAFPINQPSSIMTYRCHRFKNEKLAPVALLEQIQKSLLDKQKIYVVTDSKKQADKMEIALKKQGVSLLAITSDSVNFPVTKAFLDAPDVYLKEHQPDVVIVSPAVQSGISIESNYFNAVFGIYTGTVTPVVFQQMLHRVRAQKVFDIVLPQIFAANTHELENPTAILMASYQQHIKQFGEKHATFDPQTNITHIGQLRVKEDHGKIHIEGDLLFERYEKLTADMQALENQQRHYAAQFLLLQAKARGITVDVIAHDLDESTTEFFKTTKQNLQTELDINRALALCGQDKLSEGEYQTLQIKGAKTQDEVNAINRHEIASQLAINEVTPEDIDFFNNQGAKSIGNYKALCNGTIHAHTLDEEDKRKGVAKTNARWRKCKVALLDLLFTQLEIDRETGQGTYEKTQAKKVRETLVNDEELSRYILFKLKLKTTSHLADTAFINKLFKKLLGLKTKRVQAREGEDRHWIYELHPETFAQLKQYYENGLQQQTTQELTRCHQE